MALFEQVEARFWDTTIQNGVLPPLTPDVVAAAERELSVKLPDGLIRLLRVQNGSAVADAWCACPVAPNVYADDYVPFDHVFGIAPADTPGVITLLDTAYLVREWDLPTRVVLLSGDGHSWIALDYRASGPDNEPAITFIDNEMGHEFRLAPNFRTFVESLTSSDVYAD
jgi:hypothetical protein